MDSASSKESVMLKFLQFNRRFFLAGSAAALAFGPGSALAVTESNARKLIESAVGDINRLIASGKSEAALLRDFKAVFRRYGDVRTIALTTLGPARRSASSSDLNAYVTAFETYFTNKYGRRFREFNGGVISITETRPSKSYVEVRSLSKIPGQQPFAVFWRVSDSSGAPKIQNMIVGGINVLTAERRTIRGMLDRSKGDIGALTQRLISQS